jgi:hypothetical protein
MGEEELRMRRQVLLIQSLGKDERVKGGSSPGNRFDLGNGELRRHYVREDKDGNTMIHLYNILFWIATLGFLVWMA